MVVVLVELELVLLRVLDDIVVAGVTVTEPAVRDENVIADVIDELLLEIPCEPVLSLLANRFLINVDVVDATVPDDGVLGEPLDFGGALR